MTNKSKLSQEMIDAREVATTKQKIASLGLDPEEIMPKLQAKMGQHACKFVLEAMSRPGPLCNRTGETFKKSRALISAYANEDISNEQLARALGAKTKKEATAQTIKIQEAAAKYRLEQDLTEFPEINITDIQNDAALKQTQAELRISRRAEKDAALKQAQAELRISRRTEKDAVLKPVERENTEQTVATPIKPEKTQTSKIPFTFEPIEVSDIYNPWQKPVQTPEVTSTQTTEVATVQPETIESSGTPMDPLRDKAREELARLKASKKGELTLEELTKAGISDADMEKAVTTENITEIHAGKSAIKSAQAAPKYHRGSGCAYNVRKALEAGGFKGSTYDRNEKITSGRKRGSYLNGTTQCRTLRNKDGYYTFEFDCNMSGNPEIANLKEPGTYIGWEAKPDSIQPLGHGAIMDTKGVWHGGLKQDAQYMSSSAPAQRYKSDTYTVGFFGDCTASDKLAEDMLYQKYVREERDRQNKTKTGQKNQNEQLAMAAAQNERG